MKKKWGGRCWIVRMDPRRWEEGKKRNLSGGGEGDTYSPESGPRDHAFFPDQLFEINSCINRGSQFVHFLILMLYRELREWGR
jgi:hypothetical protein